MKKYYAGLDLGGTFVKGGIVDDKGNIVAKDKIPTGKDRPYEEIAADMAAYLADSWIYARLDAADASVTENSLAASFAQAEKTPCKSAGSTLQ